MARLGRLVDGCALAPRQAIVRECIGLGVEVTLPPRARRLHRGAASRALRGAKTLTARAALAVLGAPEHLAATVPQSAIAPTQVEDWVHAAAEEEQPYHMPKLDVGAKADRPAEFRHLQRMQADALRRAVLAVLWVPTAALAPDSCVARRVARLVPYEQSAPAGRIIMDGLDLLMVRPRAAPSDVCGVGEGVVLPDARRRMSHSQLPLPAVDVAE